MKHLLFILLTLFLFQNTSAQHSFKAIVKADGEEAELLAGSTAHIADTTLAATADSNGVVVLENIPNGEQTIEFSLLGYFKKKIKVVFPQPANAAVTEVELISQAEEIDEVIVTSTRNYQKPE